MPSFTLVQASQQIREWRQKLNSALMYLNDNQYDGSVVNDPTITGGKIDNTVIGSISPTSGVFSNVSLNNPLPILSGGTGSITAAGARANLELKQAATRDVGTAAGEVLEPGAFGLGADYSSAGSAVANANNVDSGNLFFRVSATTSNGPGYDAIVTQYTRGSNRRIQVSYELPASGSTGRVDRRLLTQDGWSTWNPLGEAFPVGSVYINANNSSNPGTLLGYGTWERFGEGKFILGEGGGYSIGATGGTAAETLTTSQIPEHRHESGNITTSNTGGHSHGGNTSNTGNHIHGTIGRNQDSGGSSTPYHSFTRYTGAVGSINQMNSSGSHSHNIATNNTGAHAHNTFGYTAFVGSTESHNNMPPYIVAYMWVRTA